MYNGNMPVTRARTLREAREKLEAIVQEPHREVEIICLPPEASAESDLEDINEDDLLEVEPQDVVGELEVQCESDEEDNAPRRPRKKAKKGTLFDPRKTVSCISTLSVFYRPTKEGRERMETR